MRNIIALSCIVIILLMSGACKKDKDIRDSLVGTYKCIEHSAAWMGFPQDDYDTILGVVMLTISKASDNNSIIIGSNTLALSLSSDTQAQYTVYNYYNCGEPSQANFTIRNDSIWYLNIKLCGLSGYEGYYYVGHKQ